MSSLDLKKAAELAIDYARKSGMDESEVALHQGVGISVDARQQALETVEKHNDAQFVVSVYKDRKTGSASSADMTEAGIKGSIDAAISIASYTGSDLFTVAIIYQFNYKITFLNSFIFRSISLFFISVN